ncbi:MAG: hypothetical protein EPN91_05865 [Salinibacterium sp.]|nr:MAG: hypothetical protein EPN91_05865 [Salinibacterium sp.]
MTDKSEPSTLLIIDEKGGATVGPAPTPQELDRMRAFIDRPRFNDFLLRSIPGDFYEVSKEEIMGKHGTAVYILRLGDGWMAPKGSQPTTEPAIASSDPNQPTSPFCTTPGCPRRFNHAGSCDDK